MLEIGIKAPEFTLLDKNGKSVSLSDYLGKKVIIYFYPKDDTPGCTQQACAFRDIYNDFKDLDVIVIGISKDSAESHAKFAEKYDLPFILLADTEKKVINAYDVWVVKMMFGKKTYGVSRSTYIIDEKGNIEHVFVKASPASNAQDILDYLRVENE